jgi:predicted transcriptional regulator of viral defense system
MTDMAAPDYASLYALASTQAGYFTTRQAGAHGVSWRALTHHAHSGRFQRVRRGLYRFRDYPSSPYEDVVAAWLAVGAERSVVSHETALDIYDLTDLIPSAVNLTVPRAQRGMRPPTGVKLHTTLQPLREDEVTIREGMRLTTPERTLLDVAEAGTAPDQVGRGILAALKRGWVTPAQLRDHAAERGGRVAELVATALQTGAESSP